MRESIDSIPDSIPDSDETDPALLNPAVARCCEAADSAYNEAAERGSEYLARSAANEAYRRSMPPLAGAENIRDFIACVAHGMLTNSICGSDATRLLYAAQVAFTTVRERTAKAKAKATKD